MKLTTVSQDLRACVCAALLFLQPLPGIASAQTAPAKSDAALSQAAPQAAPPQSGQQQQPTPSNKPSPVTGTPANDFLTGGGPTAAPAPPPPGRKKIGVALGGGGALALSDIGVLQWMEENHIPVDVIAGTSMGSLIGALYATGHSPQQMADLTRADVFNKVFRISADFRQLNFRRREDRRFLPGGFDLGLRKGVSVRNGVLLDYGLNEFLNAQFLPYGADFDFNNLPLPFRCVATDVLVGREAVFARGPLAEAVRASISIPGVFPPLEDGGHIYVDGALVENLPTDVVKRELHADVVLAVSLPLTPPSAGDTSSVLGLLARSFSVASWSNEVRSRLQADVVIEPITPPGLSAADYAKSAEMAKAGYEAAKLMAPKLLPYRLSDADWDAYQNARHARQAKPVNNIATVKVIAPTGRNATGVRNTVLDLPGQPLDTAHVEARLDDVRSDGRFQTDYFLTKPGQVLDTDVTGPANVGRKVEGRELLHPEERRGPGDDLAVKLVEQQEAGAANPTAVQTAEANTAATAASVAPTVAPTAPGKAPAYETVAPTAPGKAPAYETVAPSSRGHIALATANPPAGYTPAPNDVDLNLWVRDRPGGPPYLLLGGNIIAQTGGTTRATLDGVLTNQDLWGYGSELRTTFRFGYLTQIQPEYYRQFHYHFFVAPRLQYYSSPENIWANQQKIAQRQDTQAGGGFDLGYAPSHYTEIRAGWQEIVEHWTTTTGSDGLPDVRTTAQNARILYRFNNQDRAMVPLKGLRVDASAGLMHIGLNLNVPRLEAVGTYFRDIGHGNTLSFSGEGGSFAGRAVPDPFRFTLGGPLRLTASAYDEYRGTDYMLLRPAYFRRIAKLPDPLGQSIYVIGTYELGRIGSPGNPTLMRQDVFLGIAAETPIGALTLGPAIGDNGHRKFVFTLGRFF